MLKNIISERAQGCFVLNSVKEEQNISDRHSLSTQVTLIIFCAFSGWVLVFIKVSFYLIDTFFSFFFCRKA